MPPPKKAPSTSVKIRQEIHRMARHIADHRDVDIADYLSDLLFDLVKKDYDKMLDELCADRLPRPSKK